MVVQLKFDFGEVPNHRNKLKLWSRMISSNYCILIISDDDGMLKKVSDPIFNIMNITILNSFNKFLWGTRGVICHLYYLLTIPTIFQPRHVKNLCEDLGSSVLSLLIP